MIAKLAGQVSDVFDGYVVVMVSGVGYKVEGITALEGQSVELYIYTHVREQEIRLFGFFDKDSLNLFEKLLSVSGVGPKSAISMIAALGAGTIIDAVLNDDSATLKAPGVGAKTAHRIVLELKGKLKFGDAKGSSTSNIDRQTIDDAVMALEGLGYARTDILEAIKHLDVKQSWQSVDIIKQALQILAKSK